MNKCVFQFMVLAALLVAGAHAEPATTQQAPVFTANNRINCGAKAIWQKEGYGQLTLCIDNDAIGNLFEMFNFGKMDISPVFFLDIKTDISGKSVTYNAVPRDSTASDVKLGTYKLQMALQDDGLVKIESVCTLEQPELVKNRYSVLDLPSYLKLTGRYTKDGKTTEFDDKAKTFTEEELKGATITFFPETPDRMFSIQPVSLSEMKVEGSRITFHAGKDNRMSFLLDLRSQEAAGDAPELSRNGIDFWGVDRLRLPDYTASKNFILNPSFEAGFHYWGFPNYVHSMVPLKYRDAYSIDNQTPHSGKNSLKLKAFPSRSPSSLGAFPIPFIPGEKYTYSFYAKGSKDTSLSLFVWGRGQVSQMFPENVLKFDVTREWKRFSIPFDAKERFSSIYFDAQATDGSEDGFVWVDDVQLEVGELTEFKQPVVSSQLLSSARGNFLKFGDKPDLKLDIHTAPNASGTVAVAVEDFYFKKVFEKSYPFKTDAAGTCTIPLDALEGQVVKEKLRGVWVVSAVFKLDGNDRAFRDFYRFSIMDFLDNTQKNKNLFNITYVYSHQAGGPHYERALERERAIGFGSICYDFMKFANDMDYAMDEERVKLAEKYGFEFMGRPVLKLHDGVGGEISEKQGAVVMQNIKEKVNPTEAELKEFEGICELKARSRPWNKIWWFTGESNPGVMPLESNPDAFAKFLLATSRGIKKGNPNAKVLVEGGPWTMEPQYGGKWTERYIQDTRRLDPSVKFDGAAAHHYRDFPEKPDLDSDIASFLEMLDRNGCSDWPFYVNEGGNYAPFNIPQEGLSPYIQHSANAWYIGPLSYDFGRAERISAAFTARNWLIGLKYANRVACMQDFNTTNRYVDYDFTSRPYEKIPNTLGRLLGNATFYRDIRFAPYTRCYVFKDDKTGVPIAAIWGHKESVDRWKEKPPTYTFGFGDQKIKFVDLMENEVSYPSDSSGRTAIPISSFPFFVVGSVGGEEALCSAISGAIAADGANAPAVKVVAYPKASGQIAVGFTNPVEKAFAGEVKLSLNGVEKPMTLSVPSRGNSEVLLSPANVEPGKKQPFEFSWSVNGSQPAAVSGSYVLIKPSGTGAQKDDFTAWKGIPSIDLGSGNSAKLRISGYNVEILLETSNAKSTIEAFAGTGFYFDPMGNPETWTLPRTVKQDLAVFELVKSAGGKLEAMCHFVQGTQAGSGSHLVAGQVQKLVVVKTDNAGGRALLVSFPRTVLAPFDPKAGNRLGLNIAVPNGKQAVASLAPIREFKTAAEPGELDLVLIVVGQ